MTQSGNRCAEPVTCSMWAWGGRGWGIRPFTENLVQCVLGVPSAGKLLLKVTQLALCQSRDLNLNLSDFPGPWNHHCSSPAAQFIKNHQGRASLVAQWLRVCLPNAGHTGSSPGLGRSHMPRSNYAREPRLLSLRVWSLCSATGEAAIVRGPRTAMRNGPRLPQLEKALAQKRRPNTAIDK